MNERAAGILMPISSLPSEYGIGCFSKSAYEFVDWLKDAGQSYWQILPLGPTSYGDSPYQSFSTLAYVPTDNTRTLTVRLVIADAKFIHIIKRSSLHRF